jgi:hypothetical protein
MNNNMKKATVIFQNENKDKSLILELSLDESNGDVNVKIESIPKSSIREILDSNDFYIQLAGILMNELGDIQDITPKI